MPVGTDMALAFPNCQDLSPEEVSKRGGYPFIVNKGDLLVFATAV